nr:uncharacterized protein LOC113830622 [Penaeus vannamei]
MNRVFSGQIERDCNYFWMIAIYSEDIKTHLPILAEALQRLIQAGLKSGTWNVKPALDKLAAVRNFPRPKNRKEVRRFLGLSGRRIQNRKKPLLFLERTWLRNQYSKHLISGKHGILALTSQGAIGAVLAQRYEGHFCPVAYYSRQLKAAESRLEKEALAIIEALKKFKPLVWGLEVVVLSDNRSLHWLFHKAKDGNARVTRWALTAQSFGGKNYVPSREA